MERNNSLSIITTGGGKITAEICTESPVTSAKKRRRGPGQLFKVALFMIRRRSFKTKPADVAAGGGGGHVLNRLVGSMRPLHLHQSGQSPEDSPAESPAATRDYSEEEDEGMSSRYGSAGNLQEMETESRYASAENLRDMDVDESGSAEGDGDEMINAKAEIFIAQFYAQIRLQRLESIDRRWNEMVERSIA